MERVGVLGADSDPMNLKGDAAPGCREGAPSARTMCALEIALKGYGIR